MTMSRHRAASPRSSEVRLWAAAFAAAAVLSAVPLLAVTFPPTTDLPQHMSQVRLLLDASRGGDAYRVNWLGANTLAYWPLAGFWLAVSPIASGRLTLLLLVLAAVGAIFLLARRRGRPLESAILASLLVFGPALYWGFLSFLAGWPIFLLWLDESERPLTARRGAALAGASLLLYLGHVLWLAVAGIWLVIRVVSARDRRDGALRLATLLPAALAAAAWYSRLSAARGAGAFDLAPHWLTAPVARLAPSALVDAMFGGLRGAGEPLVAALIVAWAAAAVLTNRGRIRKGLDGGLLGAAALFLAVVLIAPDKYMNTLFFSQRWLSPATALVLLGLPAPRLPRAAALAVPSLALLIFSVHTATAWRTFERHELAGLHACLNALPQGGGRLLGLDIVKTSHRIKGRPFLQISAYGQVLNGVDLDFSFAEHATGIVSYKRSPSNKWTRGLAWFPERMVVSDLPYFDHVLVNAPDAIHARLAVDRYLKSTGSGSRWRLYRVDHAALRADALEGRRGP